MTMVPRTGPLSANSALARTSWYHWGKSVAWGARTLLGAMAPRCYDLGTSPPCAAPRCAPPSRGSGLRSGTHPAYGCLVVERGVAHRDDGAVAPIDTAPLPGTGPGSRRV